MELRDKVIAHVRAAGYEPHTNSPNGYLWFATCPVHDGATDRAIVRISSGANLEFTCVCDGPTKTGPKPAEPDEVITAYGLETLFPTQAAYLDKLKAALVDTDGLDSIPDPEPLIGPDILFQDSLAWMVGKPGSMKSFVALDMAGCVGTGEPWQGYKATQGQVLYVVAEGVRGTKKRVRAWELAMGHPMTGVMFLPVAVQAGVPTQWDALVELVQELKPAFVILDTQARVTVGLEENSNTAMGQFVAQAERLREASRACVAIVHHIGRNGETGRGATALDGAVGTTIKITKDEDDRLTLECQKSKDGEQWEDIHLRPAKMGESIVLVPDDGRKPAGSEVSTGAGKMIRIWWEHHATNTVGAGALVDVVAPKSTFYRLVRELEKAGIVTVDKTGRYPRYQLLRCPSCDQ